MISSRLLLLEVALVVLALLTVAPAEARNRALEAIASGRVATHAQALAGDVVCIVNSDKDDAENKLNVVIIKALAAGKTIHEMQTQTTVASNGVKGVTDAITAFVTGKSCSDIFFAGHGLNGKIYFKNQNGKNNGFPYADIFAHAKPSATKVHFAACTCNAGADAKLGLCSTGVLVPYIKNSVNGWLVLPAMDPFDRAFYLAKYNPVVEEIVGANGNFDLSKQAANLDAIADQKGAVNFVTLGAGGAMDSTPMAKADWKPKVAQKLPQKERSCTMASCVIM